MMHLKVFTVIVVGFIFISCANGELTDNSAKYEHCSEEYKLPYPEYKDKFQLHQLTDADEDKAKCYVNCIYKEVYPARIHEDGSLDFDEMTKPTKPEFLDQARECFKYKAEDDHCLTTFKQHICFTAIH